MFKSLSSRLIAYFILLVFIPTIAGGVIILIQTNSSQKKQAGQLQKQVSKRIASELNNYVESNKDYILQTLNILDFFSGDKNINDKTLDIFNYKNTFEEIAYTDKNGKEVAKYHRYKVFYEHEKQDLSSDISFLFPKINDKVYYSSAAFDNSSGEPLLKISIPVHNPYSGEFSGVFIASLRLKPIWNLLREADTLPGQTVYILDSKNRVIAHPNPSIALKNTYYMLSDNHIANGISGKKSIIESTKVNFGNQILTVVAEQDLKYAMELSYKNRTVIVAAVSASMIMIAVLILTLIKHLVAPVENMVKVSKDIAKGDFSKKAIVYRNDELGHLAESFNSMTQKLQDNNEQLAQFNIGLQNKIKEEIEKTRHVEQILYEQKKFADMGQMMNAIAHQWRQPLNNIGLMTQYLYDAYVCNEINQKEYKRISDDLLTIVQEMSNTIDDFRNFFSGNKESTDFNVIMTILTFLRLIDAQLNNSKVQVEVTCNCDGEEKTFKAHQRSEF
jgi:HAMP domain-containing protein